MNIIPFTCQSCGATIKTSPGQRAATCIFCHSTMQLSPQARAVTPLLSTEQITPLDSRVEQLELENSVLRLQQQLVELDRAWDLERRRYYFRANYSLHEPTIEWVVLYMFFGVVVAMIGLTLFVILPAWGTLALLLSAALLYRGWSISKRQHRYEVKAKEHKRHHNEVGTRLNQQRQLLNTLATRRRLGRMVSRVTDLY